MVVRREPITSAKRASEMTGARARRLLEARWRGSVVTSFAQNAEDVRLWRVFATKGTGFYVDVGAGHPVNNSVTKLFSDAGWSGLNVEPGPDFALLAEARPRDTTVDVAIAARSTEAQMWVVSPFPELTSFVRPPAELLPEAATVRPMTVRTARLDDLVAEHAPGVQIDFLKIDVEGAERDVLESFDPRVLRPGIVVVEGIAPLTNRPTHEEWEFLLLRGGYVFAAFDGINRFYVPEESSELVPALAYPVSVLDRYVHHPLLAGENPDAEELLPPPASWIDPDEARELRSAVRCATETVAAMQSTLSWRVTRPLRALRSAQRRTMVASRAERTARRGTRAEPAVVDGALASRLTQATQLLLDRGGDVAPQEELQSVEAALADVRDALPSSTVDTQAAAWLLLTAVDGAYPGERDVEHAAQALRTAGSQFFTRALERRIADVRAAGSGSPARFDVVVDSVVVDVSQIASSSLHTGIQRVARECVSHWLRTGFSLHLTCFDREAGVARLLDEHEAERLRRWQTHLGDDRKTLSRRPSASENILVPWRCDLAIAELPAPKHSAALRGLVVSRVHRSLSLVFYDLIPFVAPESVDARMVDTFAEYLALLKHADRVSAISRQSAEDIGAFVSMLAGQGLRGPEIVEHALPTEVPPLEAVGANAASTRSRRESPLVLVVGVQAPRKNHVSVLEAGERLWRRGHRFELVFMGGNAWRAEGYFDAYVDRLQRAGMPIRVERRVSEETLWEAYRTARFTVFPSLIEGFGLPVAESLAAGTPAITSNYGSMAEIGAGGGALLVDPRNVDDLEEQMRRLLDDDLLLDRLRSEARGLDLGTWSGYTRSVWDFFFAGSASASEA